VTEGDNPNLKMLFTHTTPKP